MHPAAAVVVAAAAVVVAAPIPQLLPLNGQESLGTFDLYLHLGL